MCKALWRIIVYIYQERRMGDLKDSLDNEGGLFKYVKYRPLNIKPLCSREPLIFGHWPVTQLRRAAPFSTLIITTRDTMNFAQ